MPVWSITPNKILPFMSYVRLSFLFLGRLACTRGYTSTTAPINARNWVFFLNSEREIFFLIKMAWPVTFTHVYPPTMLRANSWIHLATLSHHPAHWATWPWATHRTVSFTEPCSADTVVLASRLFSFRTCHVTKTTRPIRHVCIQF